MQIKFEPLQMVAAFQATSAISDATSHRAWQRIDASPFIKPVLDLKTDLRI